MKLPKIYTTGYTGKKPADLKSLVERLGAKLIDIRLSPNSRVPHWRQAALLDLLGDSYYHLVVLGNLNYKERGEIRIYNLEAGVNWLRWYDGEAAILLCACEDAGTCHRRAVADALKADGFEVEELKSWQASGTMPLQFG